MSRDEDGFLARWSRRKREADVAPPAPPPAQEAAPEVEAPAGEAAPDPDAITPEELAALPPVESIDAQTDIAGFLRKGVPAALRKAALRRVWAADPAIRDYVNEAREYAYDWNVPGGVPGSGEILPTDDVPGMLRRIFGGSPAEPRPDVTQADAEPAAPDAPPPDPAAVRAGAEPASPQRDSALPAAAEERQNTPRTGPDPAPTEPSDPDRPPKRRHGGAFPV